MATKRAKAGGELGANGEWYEGGKFINTIPENAKREGSKRSKPRKVQVEPFAWVTVNEWRQSIYTKLAGVYGKVVDGKMVLNVNPQTLTHFGDTMEEVERLAERYNAGERWV
jgi:hypothetical protein